MQVWSPQQDQVSNLNIAFIHVCCLLDVCCVHVAGRSPTYGELIDLFEEKEHECTNNEGLLCSKFRKLYPKIYIGRPRRFYDTVTHIVEPTRPSLRGESRLSGSPLCSYRRRTWEPRIWNQPAG